MLALWSIIVIAPLLWTFMASFKTNTEIISTMTLWPTRPTLDNYRTAYGTPQTLELFLTSVRFAAGTAAFASVPRSPIDSAASRRTRSSSRVDGRAPWRGCRTR